MTAPSTQGLVDEFTRHVQDRLDQSQLAGNVRLDTTHTVVIIPVKGKGDVHARLRRGVGPEGVDDVIEQLQAVPSLKSLVAG